jgi:hypothetical protein
MDCQDLIFQMDFGPRENLEVHRVGGKRRNFQFIIEEF